MPEQSPVGTVLARGRRRLGTGEPPARTYTLAAPSSQQTRALPRCPCGRVPSGRWGVPTWATPPGPVRRPIVVAGAQSVPTVLLPSPRIHHRGSHGELA